MLDPHGRNVNNMRISVTQQCNLDCFYCHHEGEDEDGLINGNMTPKEIEKIADIAGKVGIKKLKITGGEPLLRRDIIEIVSRVSKHMTEVSMTTNGVLLKRYAEDMKRAGLKRVNVSFDALDRITFQRIANRNAYPEVKKGIIEAVNAGLDPVKLNMVVLKGINDHNIPRAIEFASNVGAVLQLIEFEGSKEEIEKPIFVRYHFNLSQVEEELERKAIEVKQRDMHRRRKYIVPSENNGKAEVEVVRGMHNSQFCSNCTRLRITSGGKLKPCLLRKDNHVDLIELIRSEADDSKLITSFEKAILLKEPYWGA